jgi:ribosome-binding protein aMBF1 (putative translation factor)
VREARNNRCISFEFSFCTTHIDHSTLDPFHSFCATSSKSNNPSRSMASSLNTPPRPIHHTSESQGMSQEQLAADAEIPYSSVNEIEAGKTNPTIASLMALAEALDVPPSKLVDF